MTAPSRETSTMTEEPQPLRFSQSHDGVISLIGEWPKTAAFDLSVIQYSHYLEINDDGHLVITLGKARAIYRLAKEQLYRSSLVFTLWKLEDIQHDY